MMLCHTDAKTINNSHDTIVMDYTNILHTLTDQLFVGMLILRNDFSILRYNNIALGYIRQLIHCPEPYYAPLTPNESETFSRLILQHFRDNGSSFFMQLPDQGNCSVAMAPFVISADNITPATYYQMCIVDSSKNPLCNNRENIQIYGLSSRETEIANLIIQGHSNQQIADILYISIHTVKTHVENIFKKLDVKNRVSMVHILQNTTPRAKM